ncbi:MAG: ECF transporter S component [Firmicutes bacterium]|nr:ECF transporter S component [Bacillota bacterium]
MKISTKQITLVGILSAITGVMAATGLGFFSVPNISGAMTIMHLPTIIAGALGGPIVGGFTGLIFGASSFYYFGGTVGYNIIIIFLPRILVGILSALTFKLLAKKNIYFAAGFAGFIGTITNTVGVIGLILVFKLYPLSALLPILAINFPIELIVGTLISVAILPVLYRVIKKEA